jgi:hypothetical protein
LFDKRHARDLDGGEQRADGDRRRALDVVIERAQPIPIALQQARRVVAGEVLPLQQDVRPARGNGRDEHLDEVVIFLPAHPFVAPPQVKGVVQKFPAIGADVQHDRQRGRGVQSAAGGVQRQLAYRDPHAAGAQVAETEYPLPVGDDNRHHHIEPRMSQNSRQTGFGRLRNRPRGLR